MSDAPKFDPSKPFTVEVPKFDPSKPFIVEGAAAPARETSILDRMWGTASSMVQAPTRFAQGLAEGATGEGIPEGRASQFEGGPARFAGRAIGTGGKSILDSMWENVVKAPGKMVTGEMQPGPEAETAARGTALAMAGMGGWAPGKMLPGLAERPPGFNLGGSPPPVARPPGQLLLPPPTIGVAGQPATSTPHPGMMPPGPPSMMTRPEASPPPTSPRVAAGLDPPPATYPEPPPPVRPPPPSNPQADAATVSLYRQAILPGNRRSRAPQTKAYNEAVTTGVDEIIGNQPNLRLTAPNGTPLPPGSTVPRTVGQMSEALDQSETTLFQQWNPMTQRAGEKGLRIDLAPVVSELRSLAASPEIRLSRPAVARQMEDYANLYEQQGMVSPLEAQGIIKGINKKYTEQGVPPEVQEPIARILRKAMDDGIEALEGPGWQELRNKYGALRMLDKDVTRAAERIANRPSSFLYKAGNLVASREFLHALMGNPKSLVTALGSKGATELHRFWNDPNRMIEQMFRQRMRGPPQPPPSLAAPAFRAAQPAMGMTQFPQRDPDKPLRQPVF